MPTRRAPSYLAAAGELARRLGRTLVTLHSGDETTADQAMAVLPDDIDRLAIDIPPAGLVLPSWKTSKLLAGTTFMRRTDLSAKRNLALVLSRMRGWSRILLLDDDITGLHPEHVRAATGLLDTHNAVGLQIRGFPDHSVVCHAYREAGGRQTSFIGGGALTVEVDRCNSFFPDIYNDDWFFLLGPKGRMQPVALVGQVRQKKFDPFDPHRAEAEELGDVLAEGMYWLLDQGQPVSAADGQHWASFLARRHRFIDRVLTMVADSDLDDEEKTHRINALHASLGRLAEITPGLCEKYLRAWAADRDQWRLHVSELPTGLSPQEALRELSVPAGTLTGIWAPTARCYRPRRYGHRSA